MGLIAFQQFKKRKVPGEIDKVDIVPEREGSVALGSFVFYPEEHYLLHGYEKISLTAKEVSLLRIFAQSPNEVIDRNRLQKEVWEDEGVIVGRSLDMFISRLRKKLEVDPLVNLVNIHGKGYKLEIGGEE